MEDLPLDKKAQVDLVILKSEHGQPAQIPRALMTKYPLFLAYRWDSSESEKLGRGPLVSIIPWSSKPKIQSEEVPLESYFISQVTEIELTSYRDRFSPLILKRRTDPAAMRGEKLFVQNCVGCRALTGSTKLPKFNFNEKNWKSIGQYLQAHRAENPTEISENVSPLQACEARQSSAGCAMKTE